MLGALMRFNKGIVKISHFSSVIVGAVDHHEYDRADYFNSAVRGTDCICCVCSQFYFDGVLDNNYRLQSFVVTGSRLVDTHDHLFFI